MKPHQNKPGTQFKFFTASAFYHDGTYPPNDGSDTTFSSPLCSYHVNGSTSLDDLVVLQKTHAKPVRLVLDGNWKPAIISPYMYMCRDSAATCSWT